MENARIQPENDLIAAGVLVSGTVATALLPGYLGLMICACALLLIGSWWTVSAPGRWLGLFFVSVLLLPPLPLPVGNVGPHPALIAAGLGAIAGLVRLHDWSPHWDGTATAMVLLTGTLLFTVPLAAVYSGLPVALGSLARIALFAISVYVYLFVAIGPMRWQTVSMDRVACYLLVIATAVAAFACVDFYYQLPAPAGFSPQYVWLDSGVFRRAQGLFYEASTLGNFCVFFLVMILVALFSPGEERPMRALPMLLCGCVLATALVLSYSRGSLANLVTAALVLVMVRRRHVPWRTVGKSVCVAAPLGFALLWTLFPTFAQGYWTRLFMSVQYFYASPNGVLSGRIQTWKRIFDYLAENPWTALFGIGYKTIPYTPFVGQPLVADNMYLSLLVETGVAGLLVFAYFNYQVLRASASRSSLFATWFFCFWIGELVQMLSGDLLTYWRVLPVYFLVLALAVRES